MPKTLKQKHSSQGSNFHLCKYSPCLLFSSCINERHPESQTEYQDWKELVSTQGRLEANLYEEAGGRNICSPQDGAEEG